MRRVSVRGPTEIVRDGQLWLVCPVRGENCARTSLSRLPREWAVDAMARHVELAHKLWH